MTEYMCAVHLKKEIYLVGRQAFYLLCSLQEVEFELDEAKMKMYKLTLGWLIKQKRAIKLAGTPTHLIIKFNEE